MDQERARRNRGALDAPWPACSFLRSSCSSQLELWFARRRLRASLRRRACVRIQTEFRASRARVHWRLTRALIAKHRAAVYIGKMWRGYYYRSRRSASARKDAAGAILYAAEKATWMALEAIQCLGGNGYINDNATGRLLRDAKLYEIGAGTSEIRRMLIGRELFEETA